MAFACALATAPLYAEEPTPGLITRSFTVDVKPESFTQFENAYREHLGWHDKNEGGWAWNTWQVVNGVHLGRYLLLSHGHTWADFDADVALRESQWADFLTHVAPHLENLSSSLQTFEPGLSNWPVDRPQPKLVEITQFQLRFDGFREFRSAIAEVHQAVAQKDPGRHYAWFSTLNGSNGPTMTLAVPRSSWADFEPEGTPLWSLMAEVHGASGADEIRKVISTSVSAQESYIVRYREDLSYRPSR
jgi:hypothetical protein